MKPLNIFIRQSYTEAGLLERSVIQGVINELKSKNNNPFPVNLISGAKAYTKDNFKTEYQRETGIPFTPVNFRRTRFELLDQCNGMIVIRTGMSESTAFEICYNIFAGQNVPMLFALYEDRDIKTTLLQDLEEFSDAQYVNFIQASELGHALDDFLYRVDEHRNSGERAVNL